MSQRVAAQVNPFTSTRTITRVDPEFLAVIIQFETFDLSRVIKYSVYLIQGYSINTHTLSLSPVGIDRILPQSPMLSVALI